MCTSAGAEGRVSPHFSVSSRSIHPGKPLLFVNLGISVGKKNRLIDLGHFLHSRIPPVENGPFRLDFFFTGFFWSLLLIVSRVDFIAFLLFLEAVAVREYCCSTAVWQSKIGWHLCQLCSARSSRAARASRATNLRPSGLGALGLCRKPPKLCPWRCTQPRAAKATAGVAVVGKMASITRATAFV